MRRPLNVRLGLTAVGALIVAAPAISAAADAADVPEAAEPGEPAYSPEVVVTATRTARAVDHIPGSVVSIGGPDLANIQ